MQQTMGSAGHHFISHTKALSPGAQAKDGGYGAPPHPVVVRPGQRYWPRSARRRVVITVRRVEGERALVERSETRAVSRVTLRRLLAVRDDGQGQHYQFQGFVPRRYQTWAYVWALEDGQAVVCVPEWHPKRAVRLPERLVPEPARYPGAWLRGRADLGASSAGRLQLSDFAVAGHPPETGTVAVPDLADAVAPPRHSRVMR